MGTMRWLPLALTVLVLVAGALWYSSELADHERRISRMEADRLLPQHIDESLDRIVDMIESFGERMTRMEAWRDGRPVK